MTVQEGALLWEGSPQFHKSTNIHAYMVWLERTRGLAFESYAELHAWSVRDLEAFWASIWDHFGVMSDTPVEHVLGRREMPGAEWFLGSRVNYAEHILRHEREHPDDVVLHHSSEIRPHATTSWAELGHDVRRLATRLRALGIGPGDRVCSYMPNIPETVVAMLAVTAIGAVWSSAAPEFGPDTVKDRFSQIEPKLIFAADGYSFGGRHFDRREETRQIVDAIPSIEHVIWLNYAGEADPPGFAHAAVTPWSELYALPDVALEDFRFERVPHDHPLWILFSSGTTGLPKAIVHSHVGIIVSQFKGGALHSNLKPSSVMFFYSTTGWMMWNALMRAPLMGGAAVLYDGSPVFEGFDRLWKVAEEAGATSFGASPTFIELMRKHGVVPKETIDVSSIEAVSLSGSPATPETFSWFYENVKEDLWVMSASGGTEFCTGLVVGVPTLPVHAGEIQAVGLGIDVRVLDDDGNEVSGEVGELVVAQPMPSMPLYFWGDAGDQRYRETYFSTYPGLWRHGDFIKINDHGGCYIYGRSDSTLNRYGVRIGSSEIYRTMEGIEEVLDSLVVCIETANGGFYMPLFVKLRDGGDLTPALREQINTALKTERSPRHVPDEIRAVPDIPYTLTGKKMEVPVRKILMGLPPEKCFSKDATRDGDAMDWFVDFAAARLAAMDA